MGDTTHAETTTLHAAHPETRPALSGVDVKRRTTRRLRGEQAEFLVIGDSHAVRAPALGFHEVCSCKPVPGGGAVVPLDAGVSRRLALDSGATFAVETRPLGAFDADADYDLRYRFARDAHTAIRVDGDGGAYETYHTYPERDLTVYTATDLSAHVSTPDQRSDTHPQ